MPELSKPCPICGATSATHCIDITFRPEYEVDYQIPESRYHRSVFRCDTCDVFINDHDLLGQLFYSGEYNQTTYGIRFRARYDKIMSLPPEKSDNKQRAARIHEFLQQKKKLPEKTRVLDIGSGLGVFSGEMLRYGYQMFVVDPDKLAVDHALEVVGVHDAWVGSIETFAEKYTDEGFDLITLNKVLEHVQQPVHALKAVKNLAQDEGVIYIELPDGEAASQAEGIAKRQEFCVDHLTVYSLFSLERLIKNAGLNLNEIQRIHEPSDKYTIYCFARI